MWRIIWQTVLNIWCVNKWPSRPPLFLADYKSLFTNNQNIQNSLPNDSPWEFEKLYNNLHTLKELWWLNKDNFTIVNPLPIISTFIFVIGWSLLPKYVVYVITNYQGDITFLMDLYALEISQITFFILISYFSNNLTMKKN